MNMPHKSKQWKCFDFGPPINLVPTKEPSKENHEYKKIKKTKNTLPPVKQSFNFFEKLAPIYVTDLAIHPKKIMEVEEWFNRNVSRCQKMNTTAFLLLSGPTGSGKTSTVNVICKKLNISISEWVNPVDQEYEYRGMNQIDHFVDFISESKYNSLFEHSNSRITLIKDFPNAIIQNPQQFFEILENCKYTIKQPIIFICTEASSSSLNLQRTLFPDDIIQKFNINHISFNACAPSLMKSAVKRAQELVKNHSDTYKQPSSKTIEAILASAAGDIRNAMNQFYVASLLGTNDLPSKKINSDKKTTKRKRTEETTFSLMSKDQNLGLFHGLGRVLNPKRKTVGTSWRLSHNIELLIDEFSIQPQMFTSFLFENYLKYFGDIVDVSKSAEILSLSVKLLENWERHETLVFALWISVLGLMVFNEHRVSRWNQIRAPVRVEKIKSINNADVVDLNVTDYFYYNIINKCDRFHRFNLDF